MIPIERAFDALLDYDASSASTYQPSAYTYQNDGTFLTVMVVVAIVPISIYSMFQLWREYHPEPSMIYPVDPEQGETTGSDEGEVSRAPAEMSTMETLQVFINRHLLIHSAIGSNDGAAHAEPIAMSRVICAVSGNVPNQRTIVRNTLRTLRQTRGPGDSADSIRDMKLADASPSLDDAEDYVELTATALRPV